MKVYQHACRLMIEIICQATSVNPYPVDKALTKVHQ